MARSDFNFMYTTSLPVRFFEGTSSVVAAGGSTRSQLFQGESGGNGRLLGYFYNGLSFRDGSASVAVNANTGLFGSGNLSLGVFLRMPVIGTLLIPDSARNYYAAGIFGDNTQSSPVNMRLYRVLNGVATQVGSQWTCPVVDNGFIQFEIQLENDGSNDVICRRRQNEGSALSIPGSAGWTSFTTIATDTGHGGVLNQPGYAGFGLVGSSGFSGGANNTFRMDDFRVTPVIL